MHYYKSNNIYNINEKNLILPYFKKKLNKRPYPYYKSANNRELDYNFKAKHFKLQLKNNLIKDIENSINNINLNLNKQDNINANQLNLVDSFYPTIGILEEK